MRDTEKELSVTEREGRPKREGSEREINLPSFFPISLSLSLSLSLSVRGCTEGMRDCERENVSLVMNTDHETSQSCSHGCTIS